jgi:hypothetical protein
MRRTGSAGVLARATVLTVLVTAACGHHDAQKSTDESESSGGSLAAGATSTGAAANVGDSGNAPSEGQAGEPTGSLANGGSPTGGSPTGGAVEGGTFGGSEVTGGRSGGNAGKGGTGATGVDTGGVSGSRVTGGTGGQLAGTEGGGTGGVRTGGTGIATGAAGGTGGGSVVEGPVLEYPFDNELIMWSEKTFTYPTLPKDAASSQVTATDARTLSNAVSQGKATLTVPSGTSLPHSLLSGQDVEIIIEQGASIQSVDLQDAHRIRFRGPGTIGAITIFSPESDSVSDIVFDGVVVNPHGTDVQGSTSQ